MPGQISKVRSRARSIAKINKSLTDLFQIFGTIKRKPTSALDGQTADEAADGPQKQDTSIIHDLIHLKGKDGLMLAHALKDLAKGELIIRRGYYQT